MITEQSYLWLVKDVLNNGVWVGNKRTNSKCLTILNKTIHYGSEFPLLTTRKMYWKQAICEMIAYMRCYTTKEQFHSLGVHTWDSNIDAWTTTGDGGIIYGASADKVGIGYPDIINMLKHNPSDRGIIWNFWNPEYFNQGCLRPCMFMHNFNVLNNTLYLSSYQRSLDICLGGAFNLIQTWFLLNITARLTGLNAGMIMHTIANIHIYENQVELAKEQVLRNPYNPPTFIFKKDITLEDIMYNINKDNFDDYFELKDYQYHPPIKYPFTV